MRPDSDGLVPRPNKTWARLKRMESEPDTIDRAPRMPALGKRDAVNM